MAVKGPRVDREQVDKIKSIEHKWRLQWEKERIFQADPDPNRKKYFVTFPFPYVNGFPHLGGAFTILRVDVTARYKRMRGYNVLFAQGWHATGGPIVAAALRIRRGDKKQIKSLLDMGIPEDEIEKFKDPEYWVRYFTKGWRRDLEQFGMSIDWRREFYTTYMNPYFSKFVEWQYLKLREKGKVAKGSHPVVWCPVEKKVVGDHDRPDEYAGISPQEAVIIKFKDDDGVVYPALTYRPETVFGVTNIWVNPEAEYKTAIVDGEEWIINDYMARELADQDHCVEIKGAIQGRELIGRTVTNPVTGKRVIVLPASFVDPDIGTGIVMSVPAHAPFDYQALIDLKRNPEKLAEYGISREVLESIEPIQLIKVEGYSGIPARDAVEKLGVKSQDDKGLLDKATKEVYAKEYHEGVMLEIAGKWAGKPVSEAKEEIEEWMIQEGLALRVYTLPSRVYCRCGARTHVKIVRDQWFLKYSDPEWKKVAKKAIERMRFYPEYLRPTIEQVIDWLGDWAFTHKGELGTPLPWDKEWVIESLSDSTIYMAYYTIAKYTQHPEIYGIKPDQLKPEVFDYVLLGIGDASKVAESTGIPQDLLERMREEFEYWYPVDMRISGKDLVQNHLTFFIYHHTAIFPEDKWPRGIGVNGHIKIAGEKMSKAKGNFILLRHALDWWGTDPTRWALILAGADAGMEDANFEPAVADSAVEEILGWIEWIRKTYGTGDDNHMIVDKWLLSRLNRAIREVTKAMEEQNYKTAFVEAYYNLMSDIRWYQRRRRGTHNKEVIAKVIDAQIRMLAPFIPHTAEEAWSTIGGDGFVSLAEWPNYNEDLIDDELEKAEEMIKQLIEDIREVEKFVKDARKARIIVAADWKYEFIKLVRAKREETGNLREAIRAALSEFRDKKKAGGIVQLIMKKPEVLNIATSKELEYNILRESVDFLKDETGLEIIIETEEESSHPKKRNSLPSKPAIVLE